MHRMIDRDGGGGRLDGVRVGHGVPHLVFELSMSRLQRDGCAAMLTSRLDPSFEAVVFESRTG